MTIVPKINNDSESRRLQRNMTDTQKRNSNNIKEGKLVQSALKKLRITVDELFEELRLKDIFDLNDILYGIIDPRIRVAGGKA
mgnify:CR=1 FL=1